VLALEQAALLSSDKVITLDDIRTVTPMVAH
jgi:hypothetical protein